MIAMAKYGRPSGWSVRVKEVRMKNSHSVSIRCACASNSLDLELGQSTTDESDFGNRTPRFEVGIHGFRKDGLIQV